MKPSALHLVPRPRTAPDPTDSNATAAPDSAPAPGHEQDPAPEPPKRRRSRLLPGRHRAAGKGEGRAPWRALRHLSMRWWSAANLISNAGTWMQLTVQNLLVLQITGSAATTGVSLAVQSAPGLLLGLAGGAAVDAWPRKVTATVSQAVLGLVAFATAGLIAFHMMNVVVLMVLAAVTGLIATVDGPACSLLGNDLVPAKDVPSAIALGSVVHSAGRLIGVALAGVAAAAFGTAAAYACNGVSFLFVAAVIPFLRTVRTDGGARAEERATARAEERATARVEERTEECVRAGGRAAADGRAGVRGLRGRVAGLRALLTRGRTRTRADDAKPAGPGGRQAASATGARDGLAFFVRRPRLVALAGVTAVSAVFGRNYGMTLAVLVTGPLAGGAKQFGTVSTVLAVGGILGALLAGRLQKPSVRVVGLLAAAGALLQVVAGLSPSLFVLLLLVAPMAVVESISDTAGTTVLQTDPPAHMRGRVLGVWRSASTGWGLAGPPLLGALMEWAGPRGGLVAGGLIIAGSVGAGALWDGRRAVRVEPVAAAGASETRVPELSPAA